MLIRFLEAVRKHAGDLFVGAAILWIVFLALLDLGGTLLPSWGEPEPVEHEETVREDPAQTGCSDIGGVKVCD